MLHALLFLSSYVSGFYLAIFRGPIFAFVLYEVIYFFNPDHRWWSNLVPGFSYSFFSVALMGGLWLFYYKKLSRNEILIITPFKWMFLVLFLYAITSFYAVLYEPHVDALIYYSKLIFIMLMAYQICDTVRKLNYAIYGYLFGAWYISFLTFQLGRNSGNRVEGIGTVDSPDSNGIAVALAPALIFCLYYFWVKKNIYAKVLFALAGVYIANALILINSRAAALGAAIGICYFLANLFFSRFQRKFQKSTTVFIVVAGLSGFFYLADDSFFERMDSLKSTEMEASQETGATRFFFWMAAWDMAKDYPLGNGFRGFNYYAPFYIPVGVNTGASLNRSVHSSWFEALSEIGYLGLFALLMMMYSTFKLLRLCKKKLKKDAWVDEYFKMIAMEGALLTFIVGMSFMNRMRAEILYWLILYAACAYNIYVIKKLSKENSTHKKSLK